MLEWHNRLHLHLGTLTCSILGQTKGVSHHGLAIYVKKYFKAKDNLCKLKFFIMQKYTTRRKVSICDCNLQLIMSNQHV
jgi:hypothetical protein